MDVLGRVELLTRRFPLRRLVLSLSLILSFLSLAAGSPPVATALSSVDLPPLLYICRCLRAFSV